MIGPARQLRQTLQTPRVLQTKSASGEHQLSFYFARGEGKKDTAKGEGWESLIQSGRNSVGVSLAREAEEWE